MRQSLGEQSSFALADSQQCRNPIQRRIVAENSFKIVRPFRTAIRQTVWHEQSDAKTRAPKQTDNWRSFPPQPSHSTDPFAALSCKPFASQRSIANCALAIRNCIRSCRHKLD